MIKKFLYRIFCGFFLGLSAFTPGFSGSMIAVTMGIYQDLVRIASNPFKRLKQNILFCLPLLIGAIISGVLFVFAFKFLFHTFQKATYLLFVGLIAGNLPVIFAEIKKYEFRRRYLIGGTGTFTATLALGILTAGVGHVSRTESITFSLPILALSGFAEGVIALVPGICLSMVLIIMGVYNQLLFAAESFLRMDFTDLVPFGLFFVCAIAGLMIASKRIKFVFEKSPGFANSAVFGFMAGSLFGILIQCFQLNDANFNWLLGSLMLATGFSISMLFVVMGRAMNKEELQF